MTNSRRTQQGNNNAYCQDSEISWLNWDIKDKGHALIEFTRRLTGLRHKFPILRRNLFLTGGRDEEYDLKDVTWINANGSEMNSKQWGDSGMRCFGMLIDGRAQPSGVRQRGTEATLFLVLNGHHDVVNCTLPVCSGGDQWSLLLDTNLPESKDSKDFKTGDEYGVSGRSVVLFRLN